MLEQDQPETALVAPFRRFNAPAHSDVFGLPTSWARFAIKPITRRFCREAGAALTMADTLIRRKQ
jgi:hypothetical protein